MSDENQNEKNFGPQEEPQEAPQAPEFSQNKKEENIEEIINNSLKQSGSSENSIVENTIEKIKRAMKDAVEITDNFIALGVSVLNEILNDGKKFTREDLTKEYVVNEEFGKKIENAIRYGLSIITGNEKYNSSNLDFINCKDKKERFEKMTDITLANYFFRPLWNFRKELPAIAGKNLDPSEIFNRGIQTVGNLRGVYLNSIGEEIQMNYNRLPSDKQAEFLKAISGKEVGAADIVKAQQDFPNTSYFADFLKNIREDLYAKLPSSKEYNNNQ